MSKWGAEWHITFEPTKSRAMTIGRKRSAWETPPVIFNDNEVKENEIRMLGLIADKHLTYVSQTKELAVRARQRLRFLGRAGKYIHGNRRARCTKLSYGLALKTTFLLGWARPNRTSNGSTVSRMRLHSSSVKRKLLRTLLNTDAELVH